MSIRDFERRKALQQAESSGEDLAHQQWLDAIGTAYKRLTGKPWDTLDGETAEEGVDANVGALFQWFGDELERLRKQNAAMREALGQIVDPRIVCADGLPATHAWLPPESRKLILAALQPDAGARYLSPEQVRPLVDCLAHIKTLALECREKPEIVLSAVGLSACSGVGHAKSLGL